MNKSPTLSTDRYPNMICIRSEISNLTLTSMLAEMSSLTAGIGIIGKANRWKGGIGTRNENHSIDERVVFGILIRLKPCCFLVGLDTL